MPSKRDDDGKRQTGLWLSFVEGRFYFLMAMVVLLAVGYGYGRAFNMEWIRARAATPPILRLHTLLAILWAALLVLQTGLAQAGQTRHHRSIGPWGVLLGGGLILVSLFAAVAGAQIASAHGDPGAARALLQPLEDAVLFAGLFLSAAYWRRHTLTHRRLMLLAGFVLAGTAFNRFPPSIVPPGDFGVDVDLLVVLCIGRDQIVRGRIYPVYLWVLPLLIALQVATPIASRSPVWAKVGSRIMQVSVPLSWGASDWTPPTPSPAPTPAPTKTAAS